eukprot:913438-Prorocentrum_minimum.AAC.2
MASASLTIPPRVPLQATEVRVGQQAKVEGLVNRVELNGATCRVVGRGKNGDLEVAFLAGTYISQASAYPGVSA